MKKSVGRGATLGFALAIVVLFASGGLSYENIRRISRNDALVVHTDQVLDGARDILAALFEAESRQRSYLITGERLYLEPVRAAAAAAGVGLSRLQELTVEIPLSKRGCRILSRFLPRGSIRCAPGLKFTTRKVWMAPVDLFSRAGAGGRWNSFGRSWTKCRRPSSIC